MKINIWKESLGKFEKIYEYSEHRNSVNSLQFAPEEQGLILLAGSSDGSFSVHEYRSNANNNR
jgi:protein transport protein SEC13